MLTRRTPITSSRPVLCRAAWAEDAGSVRRCPCPSPAAHPLLPLQLSSPLQPWREPQGRDRLPAPAGRCHPHTSRPVLSRPPRAAGAAGPCTHLPQRPTLPRGPAVLPTAPRPAGALGIPVHPSGESCVPLKSKPDTPPASPPRPEARWRGDDRPQGTPAEAGPLREAAGPDSSPPPLRGSVPADAAVAPPPAGAERRETDGRVGAAPTASGRGRPRGGV